MEINKKDIKEYQKEYHRKYYIKNKEKINEYNKKWYDKKYNVTARRIKKEKEYKVSYNIDKTIVTKFKIIIALEQGANDIGRVSDILNKSIKAGDFKAKTASRKTFYSKGYSFCFIKEDIEYGSIKFE